MKEIYFFFSWPELVPYIGYAQKCYPGMGLEKPAVTAIHITMLEIIFRQSPTAVLRESDPGTVPTDTISICFAYFRMTLSEKF